MFASTRSESLHAAKRVELGFMFSRSKRFQSSLTWISLPLMWLDRSRGQEQGELNLLFGRDAAGEAHLLGLLDLFGSGALLPACRISSVMCV